MLEASGKSGVFDAHGQRRRPDGSGSLREYKAGRAAIPRPEKKPPCAGTENLVYEPRPLLVVPDSRGRIHNWRMMDAEPWWRDIVVLCSGSTPASYLEYLDKRHVGWFIAGEDRVDLRAALEELNARFGVRTVRTDGGGSLNGALLREGSPRPWNRHVWHN